MARLFKPRSGPVSAYIDLHGGAGTMATLTTAPASAILAQRGYVMSR